ncbi:hypothetical protein KAT82_08370, partial [bacterium]|nr:hypothetical protein [bacterium]
MRRTLTLGVMVAVLAAVVAQVSAAADWKSLRPADYSAKVRISIDDKKLTYYHFTADEPLTFS